MNIILHSDDFLLLEHWEKSLNEKYQIIDDLDSLNLVKNSMIIMNFSACHGMCEEILNKLTLDNKVLILHRVPNIETAKYVLKLGAKGYGNALMRAHFILSAIETIKEDMIWLYPEFTTMLIDNLPSKKSEIDMKILDSLSEREKEVALLLKDGDTYKDVAQKLNITPRTIKAHAKNIYSKLFVKDRLGLALLLKQ